MSGSKLLFDTNIIIYLSKRELDISSFTKQNDVVSISAITYMECLGYSFSNKEDELIITKICDSFDCKQIIEDVVKQTIKIRRSHKIKLPDAIIAATAIVNNCTLITRNTGDFKNINGLNTINPFE